MRLDKFISHATGQPRDTVKRLIRHKRVSVNGELARLAAQHLSETDRVCLDDKVLQLPGPRYLMLHKPAGYVCATTDSEHPVVLDLLRDIDTTGLGIAGRLDIDTTGLVLLSDDGQWLHRVTSPRHQHDKVYRAVLQEAVTPETVEAFAAGMLLRGEDKPTAPARCIPLPDNGAEVYLQEGRYHQVKRMFAACGNHVLALHRVRIGAVLLDDTLAEGASRPLTQEEMESFLP